MSLCSNSNCGYYYQLPGEDYPSCHFPPDDPFPAPCEEDDFEPEPPEYASCSTCYNGDEDTPDKVACCNCCENYSFYSPID